MLSYIQGNMIFFQQEKESKDCIEWEQWAIGSYEAFRSHKYASEGWWIGIKKNGRSKAGGKTAWGQKAIQFLVIGHQQNQALENK